MTADFGMINRFGSLTVNGYKLNFKNFDKDKNGQISEEEYTNFLAGIKLDKVQFSIIDKNSDKMLSNEEFSLWEQKIAMQDAVNSLLGKVSKDFTGKTQYLGEVKNALTNYIEEFATEYTGKTSNLSKAFAKALPHEYEQIKILVLANDPATIKSAVMDEIYAQLLNNNKTYSNEGLKSIAKNLEAEADRFIKAYTGNNLKEDLKANLNAYLNSSDAETLSSAAQEFKTGVEKLGPFYDSNDLAIAKEYAKEFLQEAVNNGITINMDGLNIKTNAAITSVLNQYSDAEKLLNAIENAISGLSTVSRKDFFANEADLKAQANAEKALNSIKGNECQINITLIDFTKVDNRYFDENGQIYQRGKGWEGSKEKAFEEGKNILTSNEMKSQVKAQLEAMLNKKGIPFEEISQLFENIYTQTVQDTLNTEGMITGRGARGLSSKGKAYINVRTMCETFIKNLNTNFAKAIDEINASNTDMDLLDLDYSQAGLNEDGKPVIEPKSGADLSETCTNKETLTITFPSKKYMEKIGEKMIDNMKTQLLQKAKTMCLANGIEFDNNVFTTIFNNTKMIAINNAVTSKTIDYSFYEQTEISLNTKTLFDNFTTNFKINLSLWVAQKKSITA